MCYQRAQVPRRRYKNCPSGSRLDQSNPEEAGARYTGRGHRISQSLLLAPYSAPADPGRQVRKQKRHEINPLTSKKPSGDVKGPPKCDGEKEP